MNKIRNKFIEKVDSINIHHDFNLIRNKIEYRDIPMPVSKKRNYLLRICFSTLSFILICGVIGLFALKMNDTPYTSNLEKDLNNIILKLDSHTEDVVVNEQNIYISYPMVATACNLTNELFFTSGNWEVYQDGEKQDKSNVELKYGTNEFDIVLYRLNQVEEDYKLEITVGK